MRQRLGVAQAIAGDPRLVIVDEPTAGLDPEERLRFYRLLAELAEERIVLLSTHIVEDVAVLCARFAIIREGRLVTCTTPAEARRRLAGRIFEAVVSRHDLDELRSRHRVIQSVLLEGEIRARVHQPAGEPPRGLPAGPGDARGRLPDHHAGGAGGRAAGARAAAAGAAGDRRRDRAAPARGRPMSADRFLAVFGLELRGLLRRPMFWTMVAVLALLAWGMSTGSVMIGTGSAMVGGRKAWITSEFSSAFTLAVLSGAFYSFFLAIAAGLSVPRDDELRVGELLHATRLRAAEYVWGKAAALVAGFGLAAALHLGFMIFFNHLLPNPEMEQIRGPFALWSYLRPALLFTLPTIVFFGGVAFWVGERWRRPMLAFLLPIATGLLQFSLLWNWAPSWLDPAWNRLLMVVDPSGFRWLNETWLKLDRGAEFYNTAAVGVDGTLLLNRALFVGLGLLALGMAQRHFSFGPRRGGRGRAPALAPPRPAAARPAIGASW